MRGYTPYLIAGRLCRVSDARDRNGYLNVCFEFGGRTRILASALPMWEAQDIAKKLPEDRYAELVQTRRERQEVPA